MVTNFFSIPSASFHLGQSVPKHLGVVIIVRDGRSSRHFVSRDGKI